MSLITRCPACQTLFKVVPDQLRVSGGWVRCGMCDEIFDAASHAQQEASPLPAMVPEQSAELPLAPSPSAVTFEPTAQAEIEPAVESSDVAVAEEGVTIELESAESATEHGIAEPVDGAGNDLVDESIVEKVDAPVAEEPPATSVDDDQSSKDSAQGPEPVVSFMKSAGGHSVWHKAGVRVALALAGAGLVCGLGLQVAVHERNRIAASMPQARPALEAVCAAFDCLIAPLRQIESIVIESSAFNRIRGEVYRLSFVVKNQASIELAMPSLELTLTDAQDQAVLRRVFTPQELATVAAVLAPESEWTAAVSVAVRPPAGGGAERIAGYRVLAFYP